jgi:hypothetical protein
MYIYILFSFACSNREEKTERRKERKKESFVLTPSSKRKIFVKNIAV